MSAARADAGRLLIRVPNWLGDLVMAEPVLRAADRGGGATLVGSAHLLALFDGAFASCRRIHEDDPRAWSGHGAALLLTGSFRSAWTAARARIPVRAGLARDGRGWLLTHSMAPARELGGVPLGLGVHGRGRRWLPRPFGSVCAELAALLGIQVRDVRPRIERDAAAEGRVRAKLAALGLDPGAPFVAVNLGGPPGAAKTVPARTWAKLLRELGVRAPLCLVAGPGEERALAEAQAAGAPGTAWSGAAPSLAELAELFRLSRALVTADSGPRHLAAAVGAPAVVLCGPTDPRHTAEHLERVRFVRASERCSPCHRERCPFEGAAHQACFSSIDAREAARALSQLAPGL